jgi:hypothetical protein
LRYRDPCISIFAGRLKMEGDDLYGRGPNHQMIPNKLRT